MPNIYEMSGKKKVIIQEKTDPNITYKEIMRTIIENTTEEKCHDIYCYGSVNLCPSDIFGLEKIDKEREVEECNFGNTSCTKCWGNAIKLIGKGEE